VADSHGLSTFLGSEFGHFVDDVAKGFGGKDVSFRAEAVAG